MVGVIPNPTKSITIGISFNKVKLAVDNLTTVVQFLHLRERNQMFNSYTFARNEFLSLGVFIDININEVDENKTQINIEVRRKVGAFDESYEVQKAGQHIQEILNGISHIINNGVPKPKPKQVTSPKEGTKSTSVLGILLFFTLVIMGFLYIKKHNERKIDMVNRYMNTTK